MKKSILTIISALAILGCSQGQKSKNEETSQSKTLSYRALDGTRAKVTFEDKASKGTLTVESANGKKIELDKIDTQGKSTQYGRAGITATAKGDSLILNQNGIKIPLVIDK